MTLSSDISTTSTALSDIKQAIIDKGVTPSGNITTYATAISNISTVNNTTLTVTPTTSSQSLTPSSPYTGYSSVSVNAVTSSIDANITAGNIKKDVQILGVTGTYEGGGGIGIPREVKNGVYQMPTDSFTFSLPSDVTDVGYYGLSYAFQNCRGLTSVDLPSLTTVPGDYGLYYAFQNCTNLTSVDLSSLTTVSGYNGLHSVFISCRGLTSVDLPSLTTVSSYYSLYSAFRSCTEITNIYFRALTTSSFVTYTNQFRDMMNQTGNTTTHTLHFPSNVESTIQGLTGYPLFGGTSGYVVLAYDLPATYTLTGANATTYSRNPKHDTSTALAWKVGAYGTTDFEPAYYTSGLTDPQANDTIYSDSACTTAVTTISSIS